MGAKEVGYEGDFEFVAAFWAVVCGGFFCHKTRINIPPVTSAIQRYQKVTSRKKADIEMTIT